MARRQAGAGYTWGGAPHEPRHRRPCWAAGAGVPVKPRISSLSPGTTQVGRKVTVTGVGLGYVTSVEIGSVAVTRFTVVSASKLTFVVPSNAKTGKVTVSGPDGSATSPKKLTIQKRRK